MAVFAPDGTVQLWTSDASLHLETVPLLVPAYRVTPQLTARGDLLLARRADGFLDLLDATSGGMLGMVDVRLPPTPQQRSHAFSDGSRAVTVAEGDASGVGGTVHSWVIDPDQWRDSSCSAAGGDVSAMDLAALTGVTSLPVVRCPLKPAI